MILLCLTAYAGFPGAHQNDMVVVLGANVAVALGEVDRGRVGAGLDVWLQSQTYTEHAQDIDGEFRVWAQEHPATNYGPAFHLWRVAGGWNASAGVRFGYTWPLRMGLAGGWWPGPGLTAELAPVIAQNGYVGLDGQVALDLPWSQVRVGTALSREGLVGSRVHAGAFSPLQQPRGWDDTTADSWSDPR